MTTEADDLIDDDGRLNRRRVMREIVELSTYMAKTAGPGTSRRIRDQEKERTRVKLANAAIRGYKESVKISEREDIEEMYQILQEQTTDDSVFVDIEEWK